MAQIVITDMSFQLDSLKILKDRFGPLGRWFPTCQKPIHAGVEAVLCGLFAHAARLAELRSPQAAAEWFDHMWLVWRAQEFEAHTHHSFIDPN